MLAVIVIAIVLVRIVAEMSPAALQWLQRLYKKVARRQAVGKADVFDGNFLEVKSFYLSVYKQLPCITFIDNVDVDKVFTYIQEGNCRAVKAVYQRNWFNWQRKRLEFSRTVFQLANRRVIELGSDYAEIYFDSSQFTWASELVDALKQFEAPVKEQPYEISIITCDSKGLQLKPLGISATALNIDLYYNDDFKAVDQTIRERLYRQNDKGIILLHGLPGTGKTTYLRHLIGGMKKRVLFVSPSVADNLMNPEFIDLLIDNANAVLVIEDAENIIMDRKYNSNSSVSNLLNLSDGLLSDCLNVQIICTFNSSLNMIDSAPLRKGRLIAKYEFGKLTLDKSRKLSDHLGLQQQIERPMTLAEITNPENTHYVEPVMQAIGFRTEVVAN